MNLLVVESPAKAKTINKYLGNDFEVIATVGHFRDLAKKDGYTVVGNLVLVDLKYVPRIDNFNLDVRSVIQYA